MATDMTFGKVHYFEDFLVTAIGDLPEVDVASATGVTTAILANQRGGVVDILVATSNDDEASAVSTNLNWQVENGQLIGEARLKFDTSVADMKFFVGFGDSIASAAESSFSATTDTVTLDTMTDAIGFLFDNDATTKRVWAVAGKTDAVTVGQVLGAGYTAAALAVGTYHTFRVVIEADGFTARWYLDGALVHSYRSTAASCIGAGISLALGVWSYEQATAYEIELDYLMAESTRDSGDN